MHEHIHVTRTYVPWCSCGGQVIWAVEHSFPCLMTGSLLCCYTHQDSSSWAPGILPAPIGTPFSSHNLKIHFNNTTASPCYPSHLCSNPLKIYLLEHCSDPKLATSGSAQKIKLSFKLLYPKWVFFSFCPELNNTICFDPLPRVLKRNSSEQQDASVRKISCHLAPHLSLIPRYPHYRKKWLPKIVPWSVPVTLVLMCHTHTPYTHKINTVKIIF